MNIRNTSYPCDGGCTYASDSALSYQGGVLPPVNPVHRWRMEEDGAAVRVASVGSIDLAATNSPGNAAGIDGNAIDFDAASSQRLQDNASASNELKTFFAKGRGAITFWFRPTANAFPGGAYKVWIMKRGAAPNLYEFFIYTAGSGGNNSITVYIAKDDGSHGAFMSTGLSGLVVDQWAFVAVVWDAAQPVLRIYLDGGSNFAEVKTSAGTFTGGQDAPTYIGDDGLNRYADGRLDDLRFYEEVLTAYQVGDVYEDFTS